MISQIVHLSISKIVTKHLSDQTLTQQRATINLIESHTSFNNILSSNPQTHALPTTLKGLISSHLLQALQAVGIQHKEAADIIIQILLYISTETHEQIWKPYCKRLAKWKKQHNIQTSNQTKQTIHKQAQSQQKKPQRFTYSCLCGLLDQQHDNNNCPPEGQAQYKFNQWLTAWIQFSIFTNHILTIKT